MILVLSLLVAITATAYFRPYVMSRFLTFFNPAANSRDAGYQIQQSLIAVGSGEMFGRGFGQSVQKFKFLPESMSDSIFAVAAERIRFCRKPFYYYGFCFFVFRGLKIAIRSPDMFGGLFGRWNCYTCHISIIHKHCFNAWRHTFVRIAFDFFQPQGGTSMFFTLAEMGIILNVSRYGKSA